MTVAGGVAPALPRRSVDLRWALEVTTLAVLGTYVAMVLWVAFASGRWEGLAGDDYRLYMDATRGWLAGESFYPASQLAPYVLDQGAVLYPPVALLLFVPFTVLPSALWFWIPPAILVAMVLWHRPSRLGWIVILALVALNAFQLLNYVAGTPTTWIVAFVALATRWPAFGALVLVKPSLAPFALIGIRTRGWWMVAGGMAVVSLIMLPMTLEWVASVLNATGPKAGLLYSLANVTLCLVPVVAWWTGVRRATSAQAFRA